jgi:hypothetical protein
MLLTAKENAQKLTMFGDLRHNIERLRRGGETQAHHATLSSPTIHLYGCAK